MVTRNGESTMRRAIALAAAVLMLLTTFTPQPVAPQAKPPEAPSKQLPADYEPVRSTMLTQPARNTRPTTLHLTVQRGDTYGRWATTHCGNLQAWRSIQAVNGWPEKRIPVGKTATIACTGAPIYLTTPAQATPTSGTWVHPLASGKLAAHSGLCWGAPRSGHAHAGVDLTAPAGTPIRAVTAGTITTKAYGGTAGYYVVVTHAGNTSSRYLHLRGPSPLAKGAHVQAGQTIGQVGATGNAKGPHLHFEIHVGGKARNPAPFMRARSVNIGC